MRVLVTSVLAPVLGQNCRQLGLGFFWMYPRESSMKDALARPCSLKKNKTKQNPAFSVITWPGSKRFGFSSLIA